ncbi:hypothetical protein CCYA_CCYA13G3614 [Cyanidiococcus yangmingshanensis]|uniref:Uncharacterized protein n=1 Tax=Cyanidiococcus yangmingshanensis TaxID=2690220 RepID=A0A7J7IEG4_9RHOD|nr:hypothetical protein F1559_000556 [Cyanidiococcus yangmingshanensis]KAK4532757.1 hypothetical protein CCYA_CCYA13G3614 [Cyanidiococcus yangmingshanensis]
MATTGWTSFRRTWLKTEVMPLLGAVGLGVVVAVYHFSRKVLNSPNITFNRQDRSFGGAARYNQLDQTKVERDQHGLMSFAIDKSESIFHDDRRIYLAKRLPNPSYSPSLPTETTIKAGVSPENSGEPGPLGEQPE